MEPRSRMIAILSHTRFQKWVAVSVFILGAGVLVGWQFDIDILKRPLAGSVAMNPLTAIGFILSAVAIFYREHTSATRVLAWMIIGLGSVRLLAEVSGWNIPIDTTLYHSRLLDDRILDVPNRMVADTALSFVLVGMALLMRSANKDRAGLIELILIPVHILAVITLVGYGFKVPEFYGELPIFPIAVHTAFGFILVTVAMLLSRPLGPFISTVFGKGPGSLMTRLLLPLAVLLPVGLGALKLFGERQNFYSSEFGLMLAVIVVTTAFCIIIWRVAILLNEKDGRQQLVEKELAELNSQLEEKVAERTAQAMQSRTEAQETAKRLDESETHFRETLDNMLEGIQIIRHDWTYQYVNGTVTAHGGKSREDLLGNSMMTAYPGIENTELFSILKRCMTERVSHVFENEFTYPDGSTAWFKLSIQPVPEGVFILSIDITDRKMAEFAIKELNAGLEETVRHRTAELQASNKELEAFSYSVSHDLRAPLRAVNGFAQLLQQQYSNQLDDNGNRLLAVISSNAILMGQLIDDLLEFSRTGRTELQQTDVDMHAIVLEALGEQINGTPEKADLVHVSALPTVNCDPEMIKHVWMNLISNALKYSATVAGPKIRIWADAEDGKTTFHIQDNGVGFDMQYADKLFGVFHRLHSKRDFEGTGVGLALAHRIIGKHGGSIWAEAELNKGATFHFSLPTVKRKRAARPVAQKINVA